MVIRAHGLAVGWGLGWEVGFVGALSDQAVDKETKWPVAISAKGMYKRWSQFMGKLESHCCSQVWGRKVKQGAKTRRIRQKTVGGWGLEQEMCEWGPGGGRVWSWSPTPGRCVGWWQRPRFPGGQQWKEKRKNAHGATRKVPIAQLQSERALSKSPESLWFFCFRRYLEMNWLRLWTAWSDFRVAPALSMDLDTQRSFPTCFIQSVNKLLSFFLSLEDEIFEW